MTSSGKKPTIVFLTGAWQDVDDRIRKGQPPGGVPSVSKIWTQCLGHGFDVHVFILTPLEAGWPKETTELGGVRFHWVRQPLVGLSTWLHKTRLIGLAKPLWVLWQLRMGWRVLRSGVRPDLIYAMRTSFVVLGLLWKWLTGARLVLRNYGTWLYEIWFERRDWVQRIANLGGLLAFRLPVDLHIMTNDGTRGDKVAEWLGFPKERFRFWINGVDKCLRMPGFDAGAFKASLGLPPEAPMLLTLGRLSYWKRIDRAIDAMPRILAEVPEARLVIAGGGPLEGDLKARVARLGLEERVVFVGPVPHDRIKFYLNAADVFIMPNDLTNMCSTLIEGLMSGRAIITRDVGSTTELVTQGKNALVLKPGEADDIAGAAIWLLTHPEERRALGDRAHEGALARFQTWEERMEMETRELENLLGRAGGRSAGQGGRDAGEGSERSKSSRVEHLNRACNGNP